MVFVSPLTLQHFIFEIGRFEIINILITLLSFLIIEKFHKNTFLVLIFIFPLLNFMLLIHEGSFFMYIPMIFGFRSSDPPPFIMSCNVGLRRGSWSLTQTRRHFLKNVHYVFTLWIPQKVISPHCGNHLLSNCIIIILPNTKIKYNYCAQCFLSGAKKGIFF